MIELVVAYLTLMGIPAVDHHEVLESITPAAAVGSQQEASPDPDSPAGSGHSPSAESHSSARTLPVQPDTTVELQDGIAAHWLELARCESGNWIDGGTSFSGPIRWEWGKPGVELPPWGTSLHHGGLQFAPSTWDWVAGDLGLLDTYPHAYDAPPAVQVQVATEVQVRQGWGAWPVCSRKVGLR